MTANNLLLHPSAGYLYSDAAIQSRREWGLIQQIRSKLFPLPNGPAAVTITGSTEPFEDVLPRLEAIEGGAALAEAAPGIVRLCCASLASEYKFTLTLVVWRADLAAPAAYLIKRDGSVRELRAPAMSCHPPIEGDDLAFVKARAANPVTFGVELMERQRALKLAHGDDRPSHIVGGFCEMAIVDKTEVRTLVLRQWPEDRPGGFIDPAPPELVASEFSDALVIESIAIDNTAPTAPIVTISPYTDPGHAGETRMRVIVAPTSITPVRATFEYSANASDVSPTWTPIVPISGDVNKIHLGPNSFNTEQQNGIGKGFRVTLYSSDGTAGAKGIGVVESAPSP